MEPNVTIELYKALKNILEFEASPDFTRWKSLVEEAQKAIEYAERKGLSQ